MSEGSHHERRLTSKMQRVPTAFKPIRRLAKGGMAEVWLGEATFEDGGSFPVAIKRVLPSLLSQPLFLSLFQDEARLGMMLKHPNIVRVFEAREIQGAFLMVMELVQGISLKTLLDAAHARHAQMPLGSALYIAKEIAIALEYTHNAKDRFDKPLEIVHRDISPHNIMLSEGGEIKLADFGLSNARTHRTHMEQGFMGGKIAYVAPEVLLGHPSDHRVDLFGLGIVLWECFAGRTLFSQGTDAETLQHVIACNIPSLQDVGIPKDIDHLIHSLLLKDPADRPNQASLVRMSLERLLEKYPAHSTDIALMVSMAKTQESRFSLPPQDILSLLEDELAAFSIESQESDSEAGWAPLNPSEFKKT